jgi:hypothetical protein
MKKLLAVGSILTIGISFLSYLSQVILIKNYGYSARGIFEILGSVLAIVSTIFSFNYYTALNIFKAKNAGLPRNHKSIDMAICFIQIVICILLVYMLWDQFNKFSNLLILILLVCVIANHYANICTASMNGSGIFLKSKIIAIPGYLGAIFCIILIKNIDLQVAAGIVFSLPYIIPGVYSAVYYWNNKSFFNKSTINIKINNLIIDNLSIYIISISQIIAQKFFIIWCSKTEGMEVIGAYGFSMSLIQFLLIPATFMATIIISQNKFEKKVFFKILCFAFSYLLCSIFAIILIYKSTLFNREFFSLFNNEYFINNMKILLFSSPFMCMTILQISKCINLNIISRKIIISQVSSIFILIFVYEFLKSYTNFESPMSLSFLVSSIILSILTISKDHEK